MNVNEHALPCGVDWLWESAIDGSTREAGRTAEGYEHEARWESMAINPRC